MENALCYQFHRREYEDGLFHSVDATYILHLKDNGRLPQIEEQLSRYHPTQVVYLVENQGYKTCPKQLPESKPSHDLIDAFLQTFKHASQQGYNHILVLEDDFMFTQSPTLPHSCREIDTFLQTMPTSFIYYVGCIPYLQSVGSSHNRLYLSVGTHACIYSKPLREYILTLPPSEIIDWDVVHNLNVLKYPRYVYHQPLCYQLFPVTENSKQWFNPLGIAQFIKFTHTITGVDKRVDGYGIHYGVSKLLYVLLWILLLYIAMRLVTKKRKR